MRPLGAPVTDPRILHFCGKGQRVLFRDQEALASPLEAYGLTISG